MGFVLFLNAVFQEHDLKLMVSFDLLHGFLHIPVNTEHQTYLGFQWKGRKFVSDEGCAKYGL